MLSSPSFVYAMIAEKVFMFRLYLVRHKYKHKKNTERKINEQKHKKTKQFKRISFLFYVLLVENEKRKTIILLVISIANHPVFNIYFFFVSFWPLINIYAVQT